MAARGDVQRVAEVLERPRPGYIDRLDGARVAVAGRSGEAARLLGVFLDRLRDLTTEELCELYDETFRGERLAAVRPVAGHLARPQADRGDTPEALSALTPLLPGLEADRNPFAYAVKALCCLLMNRPPDTTSRLACRERRPVD